jgi:hypothetical protein
MNEAGTIQRRLDTGKTKAVIARSKADVKMDAQRSGKVGDGMATFMACR